MEGRRKAEGKMKEKRKEKEGEKKRVETRLAGFCIFQPCDG